MEKITSKQVRLVCWVAGCSAALGIAALASRATAGPISGIRLTPAPDVKYQPLDPNDKEGKGPQISVVFGELGKKAPLGFLFKVPPGFRPGPHLHSSDYNSIVLEGAVHDFAPGADEGQAIGPGGHWFQPGQQPHDNHCASTTPCLMFIYTPQGFDFMPVPQREDSSAGRVHSHG